MSDILNHYHCAKEAFTKLTDDDPLTRVIMENYDAFKLGSQGPDFLYYDLIDSHSKAARLTARTIHSSHIDDFFYYGLEFARTHPEYKDVALAYLCGFASHHALDTLTHPFIYHRTGKYLKGKPKTRIYAHLHKLYEVLLDTAMMQYEYSRQAVFESPEKVFIISPYTLKFLESFYSYVLPRAFNMQLPRNTIARALKSAVRFLTHLKDPTGRRKKYLKRLERLTNQDQALSSLFYPLYTNEFFILNIANNTWLDPITGEKHTESYPQLYHQAIDKSVDYFEKLYRLLDTPETDLCDVSAIFANRSYLSGLDAEEKDEAQYFDNKFIDKLANEF